MQQIIVVLAVTILFLVFSYIANSSLRKLSSKPSAYYDFGRIFPHAGRWAIMFYIIGLSILVFIFIYFSKIPLTASPA